MIAIVLSTLPFRSNQTGSACTAATLKTRVSLFEGLRVIGIYYFVAKMLLMAFVRPIQVHSHGTYYRDTDAWDAQEIRANLAALGKVRGMPVCSNIITDFQKVDDNVPQHGRHAASLF